MKPGRGPKEVDPEAKPFLSFRYCKAKCFACDQCGYFWGPEHPNESFRGKPATWPKSNGYGGTIRKVDP